MGVVIRQSLKGTILTYVGAGIGFVTQFYHLVIPLVFILTFCRMQFMFHGRMNQLAEYPNYFHLETGYLVSFCFNKNKQPGVKEVTVGDRTILEAVV